MAEIRGILTPVPTVVSGTLAPLVVAVDGQTQIDEKSQAIEITVNGKAVQSDDTEHGRFFVKSDSDELKITTRAKEGTTKELLSVTLPRAEVSIAGSEIRFRVPVEANEIRVDDITVAVRNGEAVYSYPDTAGWVSRIHSVEIVPGPKVIGRLYNLTFVTEAPILPPTPEFNRVQLGLGMSKYTPYLQLGFARVMGLGWEAMASFDVGFNGSELQHSDSSTKSHTHLSRLVLGLLGGKEIFGRWLSLGATGRWIFRHQPHFWAFFDPNQHSPVSGESASGLQLGLYGRTEPVRWGGFGLAARIEGLLVNTLPDARFFFVLEFNWHW